jgi:biotin transport system substrate-specific component
MTTLSAKSILNHANSKLIAKSIAFSLLIALAAQISVPLYPVPVTLQTFAIVLLSMLAGPAVGASSVALYLVEGASGLPVFAGFTSGALHLLGPTGGYLFGFLPMALFAGWCAKQGYCRHFIMAFIVALLAVSISVSLGVIVLAQYVGWNAVFAVGVAPFILGAVLKSIFAAVVAPKLLK